MCVACRVVDRCLVLTQFFLRKKQKKRRDWVKGQQRHDGNPTNRDWIAQQPSYVTARAHTRHKFSCLQQKRKLTYPLVVVVVVVVILLLFLVLYKRNVESVVSTVLHSTVVGRVVGSFQPRVADHDQFPTHRNDCHRHWGVVGAR